MKKRWVIWVLLLLLLGVMVNVAVAWGLAGFVGVPRPPAKQIAAPQPLRWPRQVAAGWPEPRQVSIGRWWCCTTIHAVGYDLLQDPRAAGAQSPAEQLSCCLYVYQWGWPMRAMEIQWSHSQPMLVSIWLFERPTEASLRSGLPVSTSITRSSERTHLPMMPVWPGFVINSLVYAAIGVVAVFGPGVVRRVRRRRRGQCVVCGYELAGLARCPECGVPCGQPNRAPNGQTST